MTKEISEEEYIDLQKRVQQNTIDWLQPYMDKITGSMTDLRDVFAMQALAGILARPDDSYYDTSGTLTVEEWRKVEHLKVALIAYSYADAMLEVRAA